MWFALSMTAVAGMATLVGGILATRKMFLSRGALAVALGFSAGAMLYVSFTDILQKSNSAFLEQHGNRSAYLLMAGAFFAGMLLLALADRIIPKDINPSEQEGVQMQTPAAKTKRRLMRGGLFIAFALCLHNFPEGFLVFMSVLNDPHTGIAIAVALAIHNIPEGIAVAAPLYAATGRRAKTVVITGLTGLAEPVGAIVGYLLLREYLTADVLGWVFGIVAGMMVFICIDELLPAAKRYETNQHQTIYGLIAGMAAIAVSIALFL
ncbi:MAG: zinc transporter ZupT [Candidatus Saccharimonadales bacterium]